MSERRWQLVWGAWAATFAAAEWAALRSGNPKAPLSYFLRSGLGVQYHPVYKRAGQVVLGGGLIWLVTHLYESGVQIGQILEQGDIHPLP